ncbi:hypothetical protein C8T65DRAFT_110375 [Cerioporus squamosus]|nr:hypothetical protein C8T65DRAFT_110375 [Cerioporus squamosus]
MDRKHTQYNLQVGRPLANCRLRPLPYLPHKLYRTGRADSGHLPHEVQSRTTQLTRTMRAYAQSRIT